MGNHEREGFYKRRPVDRHAGRLVQVSQSDVGVYGGLLGQGGAA